MISFLKSTIFGEPNAKEIEASKKMVTSLEASIKATEDAANRQLKSELRAAGKDIPLTDFKQNR